MKTRNPKKKQGQLNPHAQRLAARAAAAEKLAEATRNHLRLMKAEHKQARKAFKQAKKAAKKVRKEAKIAAKGLKARGKKGAKAAPKKRQTRRARPSRPKLRLTAKPVPEATTKMPTVREPSLSPPTANPSAVS